MCQGVSILVPSVKLIPPQLLLEDTARDGQESFAIFLNLIQSFLIKICDEFVDPEACSNNQREREREREEGEEGGRRWEGSGERDGETNPGGLISELCALVMVL
jgi:hypothetical protein